jgi:hypothetical protein
MVMIFPENFFIKKLTESRSNFEGFSRCCCLNLSDVRSDGNDVEDEVVAKVGMSCTAVNVSTPFWWPTALCGQKRSRRWLLACCCKWEWRRNCLERRIYSQREKKIVKADERLGTVVHNIGQMGTGRRREDGGWG